MKRLLTVAALAGAWLCSGSAHAAFTLNITQVGNNVVSSGTGTINLAGLNNLGLNTFWSQPQLQFDSIQIGSGAATAYTGYTGPSAIGPLPGISGASTNITTGDPVGLTLFNAVPRIFVPQSYVSGAPLAGTATFANKSIATLGLAEGSYQYTWGSGGNADSMTVNVSAVPEPGSALLLAGSAAALIGWRRRSVR